MATVQSYTKYGVDAKFNTRSNMTMVHNGGGSPDISAYPDSKTGDVIERSSDGARWGVVASSINPIAGRVVSVAGKTGVVTLGHKDVGAAPTTHTHTKAQITDLNATTSATTNSIAQRGSGGVLVVGAPTGDAHAATKEYVDSRITGGITWGNLSGKPATYSPSTHTHTVSQITDLTINASNVAETVPRRNAQGTFSVGYPSASTHVANMKYVDDEVTKAKAWSAITGKPSTYTPSTHSHTQAQVTGLPAKLTTLTTAANRVNTAISNVSGSTVSAGKLLTLSSTGRLTAVDPSGANDVVNKRYVDAEISSKTTWANTSGKPTTFPPSTHSHTQAQVTGLPAKLTTYDNAVARVEARISSISGSTVDAGKLVALTSTGRLGSVTPINIADVANKGYVDNKFSSLPAITTTVDKNTIVQRTAIGQVTVPTNPSEPQHATSRAYVDGKFDSTLLLTEDLNDVITPGFYIQNSAPNATTARNYPEAGGGGHLVVIRHGNYVKQEFTHVHALSMFYRTKYSDTWTPWKSITQTSV